MQAARRPAFLSLALLLAACGGNDSAPDSTPPNLVMVVVDTLRADHMSLYGYERETTPGLTQWAQGATVFDQASAGSSWTLPSMHMLMTGRYLAGGKLLMTPDQRPLPLILQEAGYETGAVVSNPILSPEQGYDLGYDSYQLAPTPLEPGAHNSWVASEVLERGRAVLAQQLDDGQREPWYLYLHFYDPHAPFQPVEPPPFAPETFEQKLALGKQMEAVLADEYKQYVTELVVTRVLEEIRNYDAEVLQADRDISIFLNELSAQGHDEDTWVVFTSDHGEGLWKRPPPEGDEVVKGTLMPLLVMGHGTQLMSEQVRVPLIVKGPGLPTGQRLKQPVSLVDVIPTLLDRFGLGAGMATHGVDLFESGEGHGPIYGTISRSSSVLVDGRWRLHQPADYRVERFGVAPTLFDISNDPDERKPVDDPSRVAELSANLLAWRDAREAERNGLEMSAEDQAKQDELLEVLGYSDQLGDKAGRESEEQSQ